VSNSLESEKAMLSLCSPSGREREGAVNELENVGAWLLQATI